MFLKTGHSTNTSALYTSPAVASVESVMLLVSRQCLSCFSFLHMCIQEQTFHAGMVRPFRVNGQCDEGDNLGDLVKAWHTRLAVEANCVMIVLHLPSMVCFSMCVKR